MRLKVVETYIAGSVRYEAGQVLDVPDDYGAYLQRDAPGCFELDKPTTKKTATGIKAVDRQQTGGEVR